MKFSTAMIWPSGFAIIAYPRIFGSIPTLGIRFVMNFDLPGDYGGETNKTSRRKTESLF
jgi:hypothetical protein